ncbi:hypothetical protein SNEBB_007497 [Seison nebaliae]|nr:hypothetical protein SNEBB_007497 [Seison nebaliae]
MVEPTNIRTLGIQDLRTLQNSVEFEVTSLKQTYTTFATVQDKLKRSKICLEEYTDKFPNENQALIPLTSSIYAKGKFTNKERILLDVGAGFRIETTVQRGIDHMARRLKVVEEKRSTFFEAIQNKVALRQEITKCLEEKVANQRALQRKMEKEQKKQIFFPFAYDKMAYEFNEDDLTYYNEYDEEDEEDDGLFYDEYEEDGDHPDNFEHHQNNVKQTSRKRLNTMKKKRLDTKCNEVWKILSKETRQLIDSFIAKQIIPDSQLSKQHLRLLAFYSGGDQTIFISYTRLKEDEEIELFDEMFRDLDFSYS